MPAHSIPHRLPPSPAGLDHGETPMPGLRGKIHGARNDNPPALVHTASGRLVGKKWVAVDYSYMAARSKLFDAELIADAERRSKLAVERIEGWA